MRGVAFVHGPRDSTWLDNQAVGVRSLAPPSSFMAGIGTLSVHAGNNPDEWKCKAMWPPIVTSTTYKRSIMEPEILYTT